MAKILAVGLACGLALAACSSSDDAPPVASGRGEVTSALTTSVSETPIVTSAPTTGSETTAAATSVPTTTVVESHGSIDSGKILFVVESAGAVAAGLRVIEGATMVATPVSDPSMARATWAGGDAVLFDAEVGDVRQIFRIDDYHEFAPIPVTHDSEISHFITAVADDGERLVTAPATRNPPLDLGLTIWTADGESPSLVDYDTDPFFGADSGSLSPDGSLLVYNVLDFNTRKGRVYVTDVAGGDPRPLTDEFFGLRPPKFSPDGTQVLFSGSPTDTWGGLWVVATAGGAATQLFDVPDGALAENPDWSPDGRQVVFQWFEDGWDHNELRVANLDGSNMSTIWVGGSTSVDLPDWAA